jgi:hypothetical protein
VLFWIIIFSGPTFSIQFLLGLLLAQKGQLIFPFLLIVDSILHLLLELRSKTACDGGTIEEEEQCHFLHGVKTPVNMGCQFSELFGYHQQQDNSVYYFSIAFKFIYCSNYHL